MRIGANARLLQRAKTGTLGFNLKLPLLESIGLKGGGMARLAGKVAFITGAGTGIGRATAVLFAREGTKVVVADIAAAAGEETVHLAGNGAIAIHTDVTDEASLQAAVRTIWPLRNPVWLPARSCRWIVG